ncbi:hypothetical protein C8258_18725 [Nocardia sp. MDA0666]|nr:hypothetical protein C8258_18725 [Nocardia sp. MDA0666]
MSPSDLESLLAWLGLEATLTDMAGRKQHSADDIVRKLRRADELAARVRPTHRPGLKECGGVCLAVTYAFLTC